ncbi:MAG: helix-turn-helix transcriptional regulator [Pseudomonadales bacterium]
MAKEILTSVRWYENLALLSQHCGEDDFCRMLVSTLKLISPYEHVVISAYPAAGRAFHIYNDLPSEQIAPTVERYFDGAYLLDPFYEACNKKIGSGLYRLRSLAPDKFYDTEYYKEYYAKTQLREELGLLIEVQPEVSVVVSLGIRSEDCRLSQSDLERLEVTSPLIIALCQAHWRVHLESVDFSPGEQHEQYLGEPLDIAFKNFGRDHLSERECQIVHFILKGHSSKSIADVLTISADTVKAHRKHIHTKLKISSQAELFSLFLDSISLVSMGSFDDPLTLYLSQNVNKVPG